MSDQETTIAQLRQTVREFVDARDWQQFHSPKNLSMALAIEAAELMEHFQWITPEASRAIGENPEKQAAVCEELADVLCYALAIANELEIDVSEAVSRKMEKNVLKYPADEYRGRYGPEDQSPPAIPPDVVG
jgi:NTP pyrophosphatase (non-canonical NTP hydrolase)